MSNSKLVKFNQSQHTSGEHFHLNWSPFHKSLDIRSIYIGKKTNVKKKLEFSMYHYTARKTHNFFLFFFGKKSACTKKPKSRSVLGFFLVSGVHAGFLAASDHSALRRSCTPREPTPKQNRKETSKRLHWQKKKTVKNRWSFKKMHFGDGFFIWTSFPFILLNCQHWVIKVAAASLKLEIKLCTHQVGMNTRIGTEVISTLIWLAPAFGTRLLCTVLFQA